MTPEERARQLENRRYIERVIRRRLSRERDAQGEETRQRDRGE
jgi:hypothetical protein